MERFGVSAESRPAAAAQDAVAEAFGDATESAPAPAHSQAGMAVLDLVQGVRARYIWSLLGWQDIRRLYRRSVLGPIWLTLSMGAFVGALGMLYGLLFGVEIANYVPFLALGFIIWTLISDVISDGCNAFISAEGIIKQVGLPLSVHVYRMMWRNLLILCHNAVVFVIVAALLGVWPGLNGLLALPGLVLLFLNGIWAALLFGIICARYRDVPPIVASILRICFFVTPIIWTPDLIPTRAVVLDANPFYHLIEVVRAPLLGQAPGIASWIAVLTMTFGGWVITFEVFRRYRWRIAYWV